MGGFIEPESRLADIQMRIRLAAILLVLGLVWTGAWVQPALADGYDLDARPTPVLMEFRICLPNIFQLRDYRRFWRTEFPQNKYVAILGVFAIGYKVLTCR